MSKAPIILSNKVWLPNEVVKLSDIKKHYEKKLYDQRACARCEFLEDRHCETCDTCEAFLGNFKMWKHGEIDGKPYVGIPRGDKETASKFIAKIKRPIEDRRSRRKFRCQKIVFRKEALYKFQRIAVKKLVKAKYGVLKSRPRTGKTVMGTALAVRLGYKTLIMAHQNDLLEQFMATIRDPTFTNVAAIEEKTGRELVGLCKDLADFKKYDFCLVTYQTFINKRGKKLLKKIKDMFGTVLIDEVHKEAAECYGRVVGELEPLCLIGMTGTPKRKDGKHILIEKTVGPVVWATKARALKPEVELHPTPAKSGAKWSGPGGWVRYNKFLGENEGRYNLVMDQIIKDLKNKKVERNLVIPIVFQHQADRMVKDINRRMGAKVACAFTGKVRDSKTKKPRTKLLNEMRAGKYRVCIAQRKMLLGVNVPAWNTLYEIYPISNPPNFEQEINRICTPAPGKPTPLIRFFIDDMGISRGCFRNCFRTFQEEQIPFVEKSRELLGAYLSNGFVDKDGNVTGGRSGRWGSSRRGRDRDSSMDTVNTAAGIYDQPTHYQKRFGPGTKDFGTRKIGRRF